MRRFDINGGTLSVYECGAGPAVIFIHGYPLNHTMWSEQFAALSNNNRLIAPDLRGFGASSVTDGTVSMEQMADDLAALLDAMQIRQPVTLCGLSMGGYVAFQFVRKYRDRVRSLVLCDTRSAADTPEAAAARLQMASRVLTEGAGPVADAMLPKLLRPQSAGGPAYERVQQMILSTDPRGIAAALRGMAARPDSTSMLAAIDVRTLVFVGADDAISPATEMRQLAARIPGAQFEVIPEAGHMAPMENPAAVNRVLATFLSDELHAR